MNNYTKSIVNELNGKTIVAIDDRYNDNDGAYSVAFYLDNNNTELKECKYSDGYSNLAYDAYKVNASETELLIARDIYLKNRLSVSVYKLKAIEIIGATVVLKGSKKAPNNVEVLVSNHFDSYRDYYNNLISERVEIIHPVTNDKIVVSKNCIKDVVKITFDSSPILYNGKNRV